MDYDSFCFIKASSQLEPAWVEVLTICLERDLFRLIFCSDCRNSMWQGQIKDFGCKTHDRRGSNGLTPGEVPCRAGMSVPDCIRSATVHTVHPENHTVKQQPSYLFGKENIHQAMVKKTVFFLWKKVKPIWRYCKVMFQSKLGPFYTGGWREHGGTYLTLL